MKKPLEPEQRALDAFVRTGDFSADPPGGSPAAERRDLGEASPQVTQTQSVIVQGAFYSALLVAMKAYDRLFDPEVTTFISSVNGSSLLVPLIDDTANAAVVTSEAGQDVADDPTTSGVVVPTASTYRTGLVKLSRELLEDSGISPADFLAKAFAIRLARGIGSAIVTTALAGASNGTTGGSNSTVTPDDVLSLIKSLDAAYLQSQKSGLAMSLATFLAVKGTKATTNQYIVPPNEPELFGLPVFICPSLGSPGSNAKPVLCGDFGYLAVRVVEGATTLQRLDERFADYGQVAFRGWLRASSALGFSSALKYLQQPT